MLLLSLNCTYSAKYCCIHLTCPFYEFQMGRWFCHSVSLQECLPFHGIRSCAFMLSCLGVSTSFLTSSWALLAAHTPSDCVGPFFHQSVGLLLPYFCYCAICMLTLAWSSSLRAALGYQYEIDPSISSQVAQLMSSGWSLLHLRLGVIRDKEMVRCDSGIWWKGDRAGTSSC